MDKLDEADQHFRVSHEDVCHLLMDRIQPLQRMFRIPRQEHDALASSSAVPIDQIQRIEMAQSEQRETLNQLSQRLSDRLEPNYSPSSSATTTVTSS
jgi:hypothetical protein